MFDKNWNEIIYKNNKQINKYPYDWIVSKVNRYYLKNKNLKKESVIELGSGTGNNLKFLADFGFGEIIGIEGSKQANKHAKKFLIKNKNIKLLNLDFVKLPLKDNKYLLCIDRGSITHNSLTDIQKTISEVYRVIKPGGYFFSSMFSVNHSQSLLSKKYKNHVRSFANSMGVKNGIRASFFKKNEINKLFSNFQIIEFVHEVNINYIDNNLNTAMWNIIAKKN